MASSKSSKLQNKNVVRGKYAEFWVAAFLFCKGYRILNHQYRIKGAEVDLIALKNKIVVFAEIKLRHDFVSAELAVDAHKKRRLNYAARCYLARVHNLDYDCVRFDTIAVNRFGFIKHIPNAFEGTF